MERAQSAIVKAVWLCAFAAVMVLVVMWARETWLRIRFPWDLYFWSESPFLTNLLKLDNHSSLYTAPADGNSFVYCPGLEYICYALLKPFGWELDIRFCRFIVVLIGIAAAFTGAFAATKLVQPGIPVHKRKIFFLMSCGVILLALAKNFTSDVAHPDNLHAFHAVLVFTLVFLAWESQKFRLAAAAMVMAGLGVFAKQTEAFSVLGAAICIFFCGRWNLKQRLLLASIGLLVSAASVYLLWLPKDAKFWTFEVLSHHAVDWGKVPIAIHYLLWMNLGLLVGLTFISMFTLWRAGGSARRYLLCWVVFSVFCVLPAAAGFVKIEGSANNLGIFRVWMALLICPFFGMLLNSFRQDSPGLSFPNSPPFQKAWVQTGFALVATVAILGFLPKKLIPGADYYQHEMAIEDALRKDWTQHRTILVDHGTAAIIRTGHRQVPLDRANTLLELNVGNLGAVSGMRHRIRSNYYDHLYLTVEDWYGKELMVEIEQNYELETVIPGHKLKISFDRGIQQELTMDCRIMKPKNTRRREVVIQPR